MPKQIKGTSAHKPPEPSDKGHAVIAEWIETANMPAVLPMLSQVDELIHDTLDGLQYAIKWSKAYYGLGELGWVIELAGYHKSINVVFHGGADFDSPPPLGDADRSRYIKLKSIEELAESDLADWIANAGRVPGWT